MLPGAVVSRMLADLGARVIKVEAPGAGDPMRAVPPLLGGVGAVFCAFHRGAESVCLDLKEAAGAAAFRQLCGRAQVLLESFRPGTLDRWGAGPEDLLTLHPGLVICSLSGFGNRGPDAAAVAHDINLVAWSGLLSLLPGEGLPRIQIADVAAGLMACSAVLAALLGCARSGRGAWIDQPLSGGPLPFLTLPMAEAAGGGGGLAENYLAGASPSYRLYTCADGARLAIGAVEKKFWAELVRLLELPELAERGWDTGAAGREAAERVQRKLEQKPRADWLALFRGRGLPVTAAHEPQDALGDLRAAGWIEDTPVPGGGTLAMPAPYLRSLGATPARPAPRLGEHTASVLQEFGLV
jgi:crotonobetainyl-CoA:carnitine CoA-transferase CaiB-like acyl-CoA transferase